MSIREPPIAPLHRAQRLVATVRSTGDWGPPSWRAAFAEPYDSSAHATRATPRAMECFFRGCRLQCAAWEPPHRGERAATEGWSGAAASTCGAVVGTSADRGGLLASAARYAGRSPRSPCARPLCRCLRRGRLLGVCFADRSRAPNSPRSSTVRNARKQKEKKRKKKYCKKCFEFQRCMAWRGSARCTRPGLMRGKPWALLAAGLLASPRAPCLS